MTCGDEAVEARVLAVGDGDAVVEVDGTREAVALDLVPDARPGDLVLCHAGIALSLLEAAP